MGRRVGLGFAVACLLAVAVVAVVLSRDGADRSDPSTAGGPERGGAAQSRAIDPKQQTALAFGDRSHWLQPWRAYLDTPPANRMLDAPGIQLNLIDPRTVAPTARLLAESGFRRVRIEVGWDQMDYRDPRRLRDPASLRRALELLGRAGLRPLILLNANHGGPGPMRRGQLRVTRPIRRGDPSVQLDPRSAAAVVPGLTGFDAAGRSPAVFITAVTRDGRATLSKPSPADVPAADLPASTLRFAPFAPPRTGAGRPNRSFQRTMAGWLAYVAAVTREAGSVLGPRGFDVEVWNEETFGSDFLEAAKYYDPVPAPLRGDGDVRRTILERTVAWIRSPRSGVSGIGVGDGFANQTPFPAGSTSPRGLTALDKHPYQGFLKFPDAADKHPDQRPLDARGRTDGEQVANRWRERFTPDYTVLFPEYYLTAIQTEHLIRDISPITTDVGDVAHGRRTAPRGGRPPRLWMTESNLDPAGVPLSTPGVGGGSGRPALAPGAAKRFQAKVLLRTLSAFVNKGVSAVYFYAARGRRLGFVPRPFLEAAAGGTYPGRAAGGEAMAAMRRFTEAFRGQPAGMRRRSLSLLRVTDDHDRFQFEGDGTAAHPTLYDRDVLAFLPFQLSDRRFVVPVYVMTRDIAKQYAGRSGAQAFDLPPERFRVTVGGVDGPRASARMSDPITGARVPVKVVAHTRNRVTVEIRATDYPRLLELED